MHLGKYICCLPIHYGAIIFLKLMVGSHLSPLSSEFGRMVYGNLEFASDRTFKRRTVIRCILVCFIVNQQQQNTMI